MQLFFYQQPRVANFVNVFYSLKIKVHTFLYFCHKIIWVNGNRINVQLLYMYIGTWSEIEQEPKSEPKSKPTFCYKS